MLPIHTILHPTDFSEHSEYAFRLACSLARDHNAHLLVMHVWTAPTAVVFGEVVPDLGAEDSYREAAEELHRRRPADSEVDVSYRLVEGDPAASILQIAKETCADLIVMGTHGRRGLRRLLMGSVAERVVRGAVCPVVTVKNPFPETESSAPVNSESTHEAPLQEMVVG
jgi:nucleotide-binding universal stress UspA family protein